MQGQFTLTVLNVNVIQLEIVCGFLYLMARDPMKDNPNALLLKKAHDRYVSIDFLLSCSYDSEVFVT